MNNDVRKCVLLAGSNASVFSQLRDLPAAAGGSHWDIRFQDDPERVLAGLAHESVDAIVIDNALLGMTSGAFLAKARALHGNRALLLVCDSAQTVSSFRHVADVIRLPPGCDGKQLLAMVDRAHNLAATLADEKVRTTVGDIDRLPTLPQTYQALNLAASNPDTGIADLALIIQSDPVMTIKILQLVNSAFFGRVQKTSSITHAVSFLGLELLKSLVLTAHISGAIEATKLRGFSLEHFQKYSIRIARLAQAFVVDRTLADEAFTAGIVHDIGKMVFAIQKPVQFEQIIAEVTETGVAEYVLEKKVLGVAHAEAGACLLSAWGMPWPIIECVAFHHRPSAVATDAGGCEILAAVHAADALIGIICCGEPEDRLDFAFLERVGLIGELPRWRKLVEEDADY
jgi:HD-like signal output (HDOD) protein